MAAADNSGTPCVSKPTLRESTVDRSTLLKCLNESLECGICMEQKELRLLPCQHMICLDCLAETMATASAAGQQFLCSFCRSKLELDPEQYPVCRLAREFQEQMKQLQSALIRRTSTRRSTLNRSSVRTSRERDNNNNLKGYGRRTPSTDKEFWLPMAASEAVAEGSISVEAVGDSNTQDTPDVDVEDLPICMNYLCAETNLVWVCTICNDFFCGICTLSKCKQGNQRHQLSTVREEAKKAMVQFKRFEDELKNMVYRRQGKKQSMISKLKTVSSQLTELTADQLEEHAQTLIQKSQQINQTIRSCSEQIQWYEEMQSTFCDFSESATDIEYIKLGRFALENVFKVEDIDGRPNQSSEPYLGTCEILTNDPCRSIAFSQTSLHVFAAKSITFDIVDCSTGTISQSGLSFGEIEKMKIVSDQQMLYCLCRHKNDKTRDLVVVDLTNYSELTRWRVPDWEFTGGCAVIGNHLFVGNDRAIGVYSLDGDLTGTIQHDFLIGPTSMTVCDSSTLVVCDHKSSRVISFSQEGQIIWSTKVDLPLAVATDWMDNLWVWSRSKCLTLLSKEGQIFHKIAHPVLSEISTPSSVKGMCISNGYLWVASQQRGLLRFLIKLQPDDDNGVENS